MNQNKKKYSIWKIIFLGRDPIDRKYRPKIIEYFYIGFANLLSIALILLILSQTFNSDLDFFEELKIIINTSTTRMLIAIFLANYLGIWIFGIRLIRIQDKTEEFKSFSYLVFFSSILIIFSPLAIIGSTIGFKYNEIEYI